MCNSQSHILCTHGNACALTGAATFFAGIPDAVMVANSPLWCYFYAQRHIEKQCPSAGSRFFCSQADEDAVVYGTEECLLTILQSIKQTCKPSVLLIENSCAVSLIGDDIAGIAKQAQMDCPVICIDSSGLIGGFWEGYQMAAKAYFEIMPLQPRSMVEPHTVNLLGCSVGYYNEVHDIQELQRMLTLAGYRVLACPGAGSTTKEIANMTQAQLNIVVHEELGREMAQRLQQQYDIPYVSLLPPYGINGSLNWLQTISYHMSGDDNGLQTIQREAASLQQKLSIATLEMQRVWGDIWFDSTLIAAPSSVALGIALAVRCEWIDTKRMVTVLHNGVSINQIYPDCIDKVLDGYKEGQEIEQYLAGLSGGLLMGSSGEKAILHQQAIQNVVCQPISLPVYDEAVFTNRPFMGLQGTCYLLEALWNKYIQRQESIGAASK
jgi:nitrogenase molybdenum-iron protein alpha/beta subunit